MSDPKELAEALEKAFDRAYSKQMRRSLFLVLPVVALVTLGIPVIDGLQDSSNWKRSWLKYQELFQNTSDTEICRVAIFQNMNNRGGYTWDTKQYEYYEAMRRKLNVGKCVELTKGLSSGSARTSAPNH